uniref:Uncharacterized protein n=1 Tax=Anguilla anguilla TaxID=7936 RepID=A0A0E9RN62_ANGAN
MVHKTRDLKLEYPQI